MYGGHLGKLKKNCNTFGPAFIYREKKDVAGWKQFESRTQHIGIKTSFYMQAIFEKSFKCVDKRGSIYLINSVIGCSFPNHRGNNRIDERRCCKSRRTTEEKTVRQQRKTEQS